MENINQEELSSKEKYLLKKKNKEEKLLKKERSKKIKRTVWISFLSIVGVLLVFGVVLAGYKYFSSSGDGSNSKIEVLSKEYDAGSVPIEGGLVTHTFEIKNIGEGSVEINKIWTSCMCTTAKLRVGGDTSPEFGMHTNSLFWSKEIPPGETGYVDVVFDPAFHGPTGTGPITRAIYVSTNNPDNENIEFLLSANVVK